MGKRKKIFDQHTSIDIELDRLASSAVISVALVHAKVVLVLDVYRDHVLLERLVDRVLDDVVLDTGAREVELIVVVAIGHYLVVHVLVLDCAQVAVRVEVGQIAIVTRGLSRIVQVAGTATLMMLCRRRCRLVIAHFLARSTAELDLTRP